MRQVANISGKRCNNNREICNNRSQPRDTYFNHRTPFAAKHTAARHRNRLLERARQRLEQRLGDMVRVVAVLALEVQGQPGVYTPSARMNSTVRQVLDTRPHMGCGMGASYTRYGRPEISSAQ